MDHLIGTNYEDDLSNDVYIYTNSETLRLRRRRCLRDAYELDASTSKLAGNLASFEARMQNWVSSVTMRDVIPSCGTHNHWVPAWD
jgi:hypothetical protein